MFNNGIKLRLKDEINKLHELKLENIFSEKFQKKLTHRLGKLNNLETEIKFIPLEEQLMNKLNSGERIYDFKSKFSNVKIKKRELTTSYELVHKSIFLNGKLLIIKYNFKETMTLGTFSDDKNYTQKIQIQYKIGDINSRNHVNFKTIHKFTYDPDQEDFDNFRCYKYDTLLKNELKISNDKILSEIFMQFENKLCNDHTIFSFNSNTDEIEYIFSNNIRNFLENSTEDKDLNEDEDGDDDDDDDDDEEEDFTDLIDDSEDVIQIIDNPNKSFIIKDSDTESEEVDFDDDDDDDEIEIETLEDTEEENEQNTSVISIIDSNDDHSDDHQEQNRKRKGTAKLIIKNKKKKQ